MNCEDMLPGCFGDSDLIFCSHPFDEDRAKEYRKCLKKNGATWAVAESQIRNYLQSRNARPDHIAEQLAEARKFLKL